MTFYYRILVFPDTYWK